MNKILLYVILVVAVCIGVQGFAAEVTNVELSYLNGSTVANIYVDGTIRFTHQSEEAKDGRPFRVIVDVLSATHELGAKNFMRLPKCSMQRLRTSQFSTSPEKIVRLVFDMSNETFYSISSDERTISVTFPDKACQPFTAWSSRSVVEAMRAEERSAPKIAVTTDTPYLSTSVETGATAGAVNQSIEKDRQASLASTNVKTTRATSGPSDTEANPTSETSEPRRPKATYDSRNSYGPSYVPESLASDAPVKPDAARTEPEPAVKKDAPAAKAHAEERPAMATSDISAKTAPAPKPTPAQTVKQEQKPVADKTSAPELASEPAPVKSETTTVASKPDKDATTSTSRFRRPAESAKAKGTLVAEFPGRLLIKYTSGSTRDPFETLVNDTRVNNNMIERSVPNVEGLRLVGVIESFDGDNRALFEDNSGYGYILKSGDKVRKGYVLRVESKRVYFQIFEYGWSRTVALNLEEN